MFIYYFIHFCLCWLGLHCCAGFSLVVMNGGYYLVSMGGLLIVVSSPVVEHRL